MVGWYHQFIEDELGETLGDGEGQGSLVDYSPWGRKQSGTTERLTLRLDQSDQFSHSVISDSL